MLLKVNISKTLFWNYERACEEKYLFLVSVTSSQKNTISAIETLLIQKTDNAKLTTFVQNNVCLDIMNVSTK